MYEINGRKFDSYMSAIAYGREVNAEVFEVRDNGEKIRRWTPAPAVSSKKMRVYRERCAAYAAQQSVAK